MNFIIPVAPRTKKNSQQIIWCNGRPRIIPSKEYLTYEKEAIKHIPKLEIDYPINVSATFYMGRRYKVDLVNLQEALLDAMVKAGCITDDNFRIVASMDGSRVSYDKGEPRTEVDIRRV